MTPSPITDMVADEKADLVITGHQDGAVRTWRLPNLTLLDAYQNHAGKVKAVAWHHGTSELCGADVRLSTDGHYLASTGDDAKVQIWDLRKSRE